MTAADLADRLGARPAGPGRWLARCPAHDDRRPSLGIAEGDGGRVLCHCWAGCDTAAVLAAIGMSWSDICGTPATPADRERTRREAEQRQQAEAVRRQRERARIDALRAADAALDTLAARLASVLFADAPGDADALAGQYHLLLDASRAAEAEVAA